MGIIYILRKEVAGLGQLTRIGMTTRGGEDRASEYGGVSVEARISAAATVGDAFRSSMDKQRTNI